MNDKYIAQGKTQDEAIIKGLNALGITKDEAIISVEEPGKKGFLGIGQKDAVVVVERKEKLNIVDELLTNEFDLDLDSKESDQSAQTKKRAQTSTKEKAKKEETLEEAAFATEKIDDSKKAEAKTEETHMTQKEEVEGRNPADVEIVEETEETTQEKSTSKEEDKQTEVDVAKDDQVAIDDVNKYLEDIILSMGIDDVEVFTSRVSDNVKYDIETKNAGLVIGRHGKVLNGLQTLAQNHMHQLAHSKINVRVDAEKYRERRKSTVETLAERTADKVIKTNRRVKLDPMPAHERKQIHRYLNRNPKVKTHSEGRDPKRYLVVEPANN